MLKKIDYNKTYGKYYVLRDRGLLPSLRYIGSIKIMIKLCKLGFTLYYSGTYVKGR